MTSYRWTKTVALMFGIVLGLSIGLFPTVAVEAAVECADTRTTGIPEAECQALMALYESTNGPGWKTNTNWNTPTSCSTWYGVTVEDGYVTGLELSGNRLRGPIPDLSYMTNLKELVLHNNQLSDPIPDLSYLTRLEWLSLNDNQLSGPIPDLGHLAMLKRLDLGGNRLSGPIPELNRLTQLQFLWLDNNRLSGAIPDLSRLTNLKKLNLSGNRLSGPIPDLSRLTSLQELALNRNQLTGRIPDLSPLASLQELTLNRNQLSGALPDFSGLTKLKLINLHNNQLSGALPPSITGLPLIDLKLQCNRLTTSDAAVLAFLDTHNPGWNDTAECPEALQTDATVDCTDIATTGIPEAECQTLMTLYYNTNGPDWKTNTNWGTTTACDTWHGVTVKDGHVVLLNLKILDLGFNGLTGPIPDLNGLTKLRSLCLQYNRLSGAIPDLNDLKTLASLELNSNRLSGEIPDLNGMTNLYFLNLFDNRLSGEIPPSIVGLPLRNLKLQCNNNLTVPNVKVRTFIEANDPQWNNTTGCR